MTSENPPEPEPVADPASTAELPAATPAAPTPAAGPFAAPAGLPPQPMYAPVPPPGYPFAAAPRPPREHWINPAKRTAVIAISIAAALVLLFVGAVVGHAVTKHRQVDRAIDHARQFAPNGRVNGGYFPQNGQRPGGQPARPVAPKATVTPSPSSS